VEVQEEASVTQPLPVHFFPASVPVQHLASPASPYPPPLPKQQFCALTTELTVFPSASDWQQTLNWSLMPGDSCLQRQTL
jgi:hypothetical protein